MEGSCVVCPQERSVGGWELVFEFRSFFCLNEDLRRLCLFHLSAPVEILSVFFSVLRLLRHVRFLPSRMGCINLERVVVGDCVSVSRVIQAGWNAFSLSRKLLAVRVFASQRSAR